MNKEFNSFKIETRPMMENEKVVRAAVKAFALANVPKITTCQVGDLEVCVSEAFSNAVEYGLPNNTDGTITVSAQLRNRYSLTLVVRDNGKGFDNINQAKQPMFSTGGSAHSGMGFTIMESFSNKLTVKSKLGTGTVVTMHFDYRPVIKEGMTVWLSGDSADLGIADYNVRVGSAAKVVQTPNKSDKKVLVIIDSIDGDSNVTAYVKRNALKFDEEVF